MKKTNTPSVAGEARKIFERLKASFEQSHANEFVAIEPVSGDYFFGRTLSDAIGESQARHPERLVHTFRVGHKAAVHFGLQIQ